MTGRALVVDDNQAIRFVLRQVLSEAGWSVVEVDDGSEVEEQLATQGFDLVVLDLYMPGMNGFEVLRRLRRRDPGALPAWKTSPRVKVLVISGAANRAAFRFARRIGADACLRKPFLVADVLRVVKRLSSREVREGT